MQTQSIYKNLARYYDLLYSWKDYKKEAARVRELIAQYKKSPGRDLLEVACGSGKHLQHLKDGFRALGTDLNAGILAHARRSVRGAKFLKNGLTQNRGLYVGVKP